MGHSATLFVMKKAIFAAAKGLVRDFGELDKLHVSKKGTANFVTNADTRTERILREELSKARKGYGFLLEEGGEIPGDNPNFRWVIDPLDGTSNFIHAIPYFCISVALQQKRASGQWASIAAAVYDPIHDEMFTAEDVEGGETLLNDFRVKTSERTEEWLVGTNAPRKWHSDYELALRRMEAVTSSGATIRCSGAAALDCAYVAAGRLDGLWYHSLSPWDIAAGELLVRAAGGRVQEIGGGENMVATGSVVATNRHIHEPLQNLLVPAEAA